MEQLNKEYIELLSSPGSSKNHLKGPRKRTSEDDQRFEESFEKLLCKAEEMWQRQAITIMTN